MIDSRGDMDVEGLLRIVLVLVILLLVLEVLGEVFGLLFGILGFLQPLILLAVAALLVLWLADRL